MFPLAIFLFFFLIISVTFATIVTFDISQFYISTPNIPNVSIIS